MAEKIAIIERDLAGPYKGAYVRLEFFSTMESAMERLDRMKANWNCTEHPNCSNRFEIEVYSEETE